MMRSTSFTSLLRTCLAIVAPVVVGIGIASTAPASAAATPAGTAISNTATATYQDPGGTTYNSQSNTVTTTVQNAPSMTIAPTSGAPGTNTVSPGGTITDTYTLTNTSNSAGYFQLTGVQNTDDGVTAGMGTFSTYVVNAGAGNQSFATIAAVNNYLTTGNAGGAFMTAVNGTITIGVTYQANVGASGTITTKLTPAITLPGAPTGPAGTSTATSSTVVGQYNDTVTVDARIDVQKLAVVGGSVAVPTVTYTVRFANGGARNLAPVFKNALPGGNAAAYSGCTNSTACGVAFTDKLPSYNATQLTLTAAVPTIAGATGTIIYSVDGTTWTTTQAGAVYIGVFLPATSITGAGLTTFQPNNNATSQNTVSAGNASLTLTFVMNGSTATGAANGNAITNVANSTYGDQSGFIEGPGIGVQTVANNAAATTAQTAPIIANANGALAGAGFITSAASPLNTVLFNGPNGFPQAVGPTNNNDDYTAVSYTNGGASVSAVTGNTVTVAAGAAATTITNSLQNTGNKDDTYNLTAATAAGLSALPAGWTVTFQSTGQAASGSCGAVVVNTVITSVCVPSGATQTYKTIYTPPAGATVFNAYTGYGDAITATSVNDNTKNNVTIDEIIVGGFVKLTKTWSVALLQPCATATVFTASSASVNPGDCVQYTITYLNVMPSGGTNDITVNASSFVLTEDGAAAGGAQVAYANTWAANSNGLFAAPVDSNGGVLGGYNPGPGAAGSSRFTDTIGALAAGATGNCTFKVQVK
ncbi:MAG: hypothetical protein QOF71_2710 [Candidatus Eremiobacteraeota bacterium]|jgi:hypothetical protein|nr:hypothetical protein [Candidatus Eremiobacteraeota bacterium]